MTRVVLSWICYWMGDLASRACHRWDASSRVFYPVYHRLMCWSDDLQGDDPRGPWQPAPPKQEGD